MPPDLYAISSLVDRSALRAWPLRKTHPRANR